MEAMVKAFWISTIIILATSKAKLYASSGEEKIRIPKLFFNMLIRQRMEHKSFIEDLLKKKYEEQYKMVEIAFEKILPLTMEINSTYIKLGYSPKNGFPTQPSIRDALMLLVENTCLAGDLLLHLPEISYRAMKRFPNWKEITNWALSVIGEFPDLIDQETDRMLTIFRQEINESERPADYKNPYLEGTKIKEKPKEKKKRKRLKRGPRLISRNEL